MSAPIPERVVEGIYLSVDVRGPEECWQWLKSVGNHGYGQVGWKIDGVGYGVSAHRVVWTREFGPVAGGARVGHTCANRLCCNPNHLKCQTELTMNHIPRRSMQGLTIAPSARCVATKDGHRCRMLVDNHQIVNGYTEHRWWGPGITRSQWFEQVYLNADDHATRMSERLAKELAHLRRVRRVPDAFVLGAEWARHQIEGVDVMAVSV